MERDLDSFQHRVARHITGGQTRRRWEGVWVYPPLEAAMEEEGFEEIGVYIKKRQNTAAKYIATRTILDLCERFFRRPGARVSQRWWYHEGTELEGSKYRATAVSDGEDEKLR